MPTAHTCRPTTVPAEPDLGLDEVVVYRLDPAKGTLTANNPPFFKAPGRLRPAALCVFSQRPFAYVLTEMGLGVVACRYDAQRGTLEQIQTVDAAPGNIPANSSAEIYVHPNGKFLYASLRGPDSIAVFAIDAAGKLTPAGHFPTGGKEPRAFELDPTGHFLLAATRTPIP